VHAVDEAITDGLASASAVRIVDRPRMIRLRLRRCDYSRPVGIRVLQLSYGRITSGNAWNTFQNPCALDIMDSRDVMAAPPVSGELRLIFAPLSPPKRSKPKGGRPAVPARGPLTGSAATD
jgi:hypothetical protein